MKFIDIVFDGPPDAEGPRFVEAEDENGHGIRCGEWLQRPDGEWVLRVSPMFVYRKPMTNIQRGILVGVGAVVIAGVLGDCGLIATAFAFAFIGACAFVYVGSSWEE